MTIRGRSLQWRVGANQTRGTVVLSSSVKDGGVELDPPDAKNLADQIYEALANLRWGQVIRRNVDRGTDQADYTNKDWPLREGAEIADRGTEQ